MSIEKAGGLITFHCDNCGEFFSTGLRDFKEAYAEAKSQGWVARINKHDESWGHFCEGCK